MTDGGSKDDNSPCGVGALQAGVFWLLEEKILHKGRSGVNRGDRKIFGGKRRMSPDRFCLIRATASYRWSSFLAFVEGHEGRVPLISNGNLFTLPSREEENDGVVNHDKPWSLEMLESFNELCDYPPSLSTLRFEGGDLHWRLLH